MTTDKNTLIETILSVHGNVDAENKQVKDNCIVVYNLLFLGFLDDISRSIYKFAPGVITRRGLKNLEKSLNAHISAGVRNMGANFVVANIPKTAELQNATVEEVTCAHIYDTLDQFSPLTSVTKMSNHTYVAVFNKTEDAKHVAEKIDGMLMGGSPIRAYVVYPPTGGPSKTESNKDITKRSYHEFRDFTSNPTTFDYIFVKIISCAYLMLMFYLAVTYTSNIVPSVINL